MVRSGSSKRNLVHVRLKIIGKSKYLLAIVIDCCVGCGLFVRCTSLSKNVCVSVVMVLSVGGAVMLSGYVVVSLCYCVALLALLSSLGRMATHSVA